MTARVAITGAAGGIGAAAARELRARGARVVGLDVRGGDGIVACDVRVQSSVDRAVAEAIEQLGGLDVLINNAGLGTPQSAGAAPDAAALAVVDVNLIGPWRVTAAALGALRASHGRVINVASGLAHLALPYGTAYCMSKRGLTAYSDALRLEHGDALARHVPRRVLDAVIRRRLGRLASSGHFEGSTLAGEAFRRPAS
jgi:NAD(P)-dependent dehydrogenase (short-subunit alcohol dehydrogenase family)